MKAIKLTLFSISLFLLSQFVLVEEICGQDSTKYKRNTFVFEVGATGYLQYGVVYYRDLNMERYGENVVAFMSSILAMDIGIEGGNDMRYQQNVLSAGVLIGFQFKNRNRFEFGPKFYHLSQREGYLDLDGDPERKVLFGTHHGYRFEDETLILNIYLHTVAYHGFYPAGGGLGVGFKF